MITNECVLVTVVRAAKRGVLCEKRDAAGADEEGLEQEKHRRWRGIVIGCGVDE